MDPNPFAALLHSRKFWLLILDTVASLVLYFVGKYAAPVVFEDIKLVIGLIQPVFITIIAAIAYEDGAKARTYWEMYDETDIPEGEGE